MNGRTDIFHRQRIPRETGRGQDGNARRDFRRKVRIGHQRARRGVGENMRDFAISIEDVDGHENHAEFHAGEVDVDHLYAIDEVNAEAIARAETVAGEQPC